MKRPATAFVLCVFTCIASVWARPTKDGDHWVLENRALKVTVHAKTAHMSVLSKAAGVLWSQEDPKRRTSAEEKVKARRAAFAPTIDGDARDWPNKDYIWLPWTGNDGERNCSAGAQIMWDKNRLYLYCRVRDDNVAFGGESADKWWEADSVEFWVDSVQIGLHLFPGKEVAANAKGVPYADTQIAVRMIKSGRLPGYGVELSMPLENFPILKAPIPGVRFMFAIGLNDADPKPGEPVRRVAQGYYPRSWVHSAPGTFAIAVLTDADGSAPPLTKRNDRTSSIGGEVVGMKPGRRNSLTYSLTFTRGQVKPLALHVELALDWNEPALDVTITCPGGNDTPVKSFRYPAPLFPPSPERYFMAMTNYCDGRYLPVGDKVFRNRWLVTYGGDMPWVAVTDGKQGMMTIAITPADARVQMQSRTGDDERLGFPGFGWFPSKGTFGAARVGRLVFYEKGGHVKACKIYRELAKKQGYFKTLRDKAKGNPDVLKLMGAVNWWGAHGLEFVQEAIAEGITRGLVNGRWAPDDMVEMVRLGWLVGEYDNYEDFDDSPTIARAKAPMKEHAVVKADGEFMTAWISRDKDMKPTHTYMKQCTGMMLRSARIVIPKVLETHPYNTRFLDVTTACGLKECYSDVHPVTRSSDLVHRQALGRYVSEELGLVLGGEHGRYWDVSYTHYHEGMMGGGMYSWPAGYLRAVKDRSEIKERYLNYGINPANRAPLFELVFHDCVVNYWYWGATNDYLHQVMPELTDRKTAMNILYGTPPMMWVRSHGLRWQVPEERELMLTIYRNVCRLHEVIGPQEMVSHAFLTADRMVQQTVFEDGTVCTVNFGKQPYSVSRGKGGGEKFELRENDFYVHGPGIEQWRVTEAGAAGAEPVRATYIRMDAYLFVDSGKRTFDDAGVRSTGRICVTKQGADCARITLWPKADVELSVADWQPGWKRRDRVLVKLDSAGRPCKRVSGGGAARLKLSAPGDRKESYLLLTGKEATVPDVTIERLELTSNGRRVTPSTVLASHRLVNVAIRVANHGLASAKGLVVALHLDGVGGPELLRQKVRGLRPGTSRTFNTTLPVAMTDGPRRLVAGITAPRPPSLTGRTNATALFTGALDPASFPVRRKYRIEVPQGDSGGMAVEVPFRLKQGGGVEADPVNLRVLLDGRLVAPAQFEAEEPGSGQGTLVFVLPRGLGAGTVTAEVLGVPRGSVKVFPHSPAFEAAADGSSIRTPVYSAKIAQGVLSSIAVLGPDGDALSVCESVIVSSKETGWSSETGKIEAFTCRARGPVRSVFACTKVLSDKYRLTRLWLFYLDRIEVHSSCEPQIHTLTRARYLVEATATNETGRTAQMDGKGNGEEFGFKGKPNWYAVFSDKYRNACIALTEPGGFTYWDGGVLGQISLNCAGQGVEKRVYIWGLGADSADFARAAAQAYAAGVKAVPVE